MGILAVPLFLLVDFTAKEIPHASKPWEHLHALFLHELGVACGVCRATFIWLNRRGDESVLSSLPVEATWRALLDAVRLNPNQVVLIHVQGHMVREPLEAFICHVLDRLVISSVHEVYDSTQIASGATSPRPATSRLRPEIKKRQTQKTTQTLARSPCSTPMLVRCWVILSRHARAAVLTSNSRFRPQEI